MIPSINPETVTALAGIALSMTWTPGPNNAMLSASGANYGWRRSVPHVMGVTFGFPIMLILVALGLERLLRSFPIIVTALGWVGFGMMVWFAWRIATADPSHDGTRGRPLTFLQAIAFQWVNPKAWALAFYITAGYAIGETALANTLVAAGVFLVSGLASSYTWAVFGAAIGMALKQGWRLRAFNAAMALTLLASAAWLLLGS